MLPDADTTFVRWQDLLLPGPQAIVKPLWEDLWTISCWYQCRVQIPLYDIAHVRMLKVHKDGVATTQRDSSACIVFMAALPTGSQNVAVRGTQQFASRATKPSCDWNSRQHACLVTDMTVIGNYSRVPYMYSWKVWISQGWVIIYQGHRCNCGGLP